MNQVVLSVAIIAIARKVIFLDMEQGIAAIIIALTLGYYFMKKTEEIRTPPDELSGTKHKKQQKTEYSSQYPCKRSGTNAMKLSEKIAFFCNKNPYLHAIRTGTL